ncbi:MAG: hypothetical protein JRI25_22800, partial [Deltaproteobacteria bacterium]|nr:hypothetical protein [Deltaproteobacteria bacterium]
MRLAPGMRALTLLVVVATPVAAMAQDESARTWSIESGQSQVVEVGPHRSYLVLDPDRIQVETLGPGELSVTALEDRGAAVMYVFTVGGPRTLVFYVRAPSAMGAATGAERRWGTGPGVRPQQDFSYTARGMLSGDGSSVLGGTSHGLWLSQAYEDTEIQGSLSIAGRQGMGWNVPHLRLQGRRGDLTLALGDESLTLATGVASMATRGTSFTWSPDQDRTYAGAFLGVARPSSCCA